jgi:hypothetical protein
MQPLPHPECSSTPTGLFPDLMHLRASAWQACVATRGAEAWRPQQSIQRAGVVLCADVAAPEQPEQWAQWVSQYRTSKTRERGLSAR